MFVFGPSQLTLLLGTPNMPRTVRISPAAPHDTHVIFIFPHELFWKDLPSWPEGLIHPPFGGQFEHLTFAFSNCLQSCGLAHMKIQSLKFPVSCRHFQHAQPAESQNNHHPNKDGRILLMDHHGASDS